MSIRQVLFGTAVDSPLASFGLVLLRLGFGAALAFAHGIGKIPPAEPFREGVEKLGFPAPEFFAWAAAFSEFFGALLVAIGLMTRPAALMAAIVMGVALFMVHGADPFLKKEVPFLFLIGFLTLMLTGAGRYSFDALIAKPKKS
jgi:putative oxidoreductase